MLLGTKFTSERASGSELPVVEVLAQGKGGGETHKHLDVISWAISSHHRDPPPEFLPVLGAEK